MSDGVPRPDRPRPRYGEYATPQQQAEIMARSMPPVSPELVPNDHATEVPHPAARSTPAQRAGAPTRRRWDTVLTIALLAYGILAVVSSLVQYSNLAALVQSVYDTQGIGSFVPTPLSGAMGPAIVIVNVVVFAVTAFLSIRRLRTPRLAFWIPLVGGLVAGLATGVMLVVVIVNDPAFVAFATPAY